MSVVRWEDPPNKRQLMADKWVDAAAELKAVPGSWAVLLEGDSTRAASLVQYVKTGMGPFAPRGSFEALQRSLGRGEGRNSVYARYVGEVES